MRAISDGMWIFPSSKPEGGSSLTVQARFTPPNRLIGRVLDASDPDRRFVVELLIDGYARDVARADKPHIGVGLDDPGDDHGFEFDLPPMLRDMRTPPLLELRIANTEAIIFGIRYQPPEDTAGDVARVGEVRWDGGLRLLGKLAARAPGRMDEADLTVYRDGEALDIDLVKTFVIDPEYRWGVHRFDAALPFHLADGMPHQLRVLDGMGRELPGSPLMILAHSSGFDGILGALADPVDGPLLKRAWGGFLQQLMPTSLPFASYEDWRDCYMKPSPPPDSGSVLLVSIGPSEAGPVSLPEEDHDFVATVMVEAPDGVTIPPSTWLPLAGEIERLKPHAVLFTRAGAQLMPGWRRHVIEACHGEHGGPIAYADVDLVRAGQAATPLFLPAFDRTRWMSQAYALNFLAFSPDAMRRLIAYAPASLPALVIEALGVVGDQAGAMIRHIPRVLARVPALDVASATVALASAVAEALGPVGVKAEPIGEAEQLPAIRIRYPQPIADVDILIPTRDRLDLLKPCLESLCSVTRPGRWRVWIIDNDSRASETHAYLQAFAASGRGEVIQAPGPFNYARINNLAAAMTSSALLCFLNNDVEITDPDWLETMASCLWEPDVAAVGARLLWPSGVVQHAGVILGSGFAAAHGYDHHLATDAGFADGLLVEREGSAMTAACLLMRRAEFEAVGGFDERAFPVAFNDVDLCLKLRARGRRIVWTPHATLIHKESQSRGQEDNPEKARRARRELENLRTRWGRTLAADPYYHPSLNLNSHPFSGLAMPPGSLEPRLNLPPRPDG